MNNSDHLTLVEVGPRDGLQAIKAVMPTDNKVEWIRREVAAGVSIIQVGSFVHPKLLPQMADSHDVVTACKTIEGLTTNVLIPNLKGAERALAAGADMMGQVISVSEAHNKANVNRTLQESIDEFARIVEYRDTHDPDKKTSITGGLATAFGCTIAGKIDMSDVMRAAEALTEQGAQKLNVADTVGYAGPAQVKALFTELCNSVGQHVEIGAHFHDTRGLGLANAMAAYEAGVRVFDGCLGGLGGCPYAPGASGNVVFEDMAYMFESMGVTTGIDLIKLMHARDYMIEHLNGEPVHGAFANAGWPKGFEPAYAAA